MPRRKKHQREQDLVTISHMYLQGKSQKEIARVIGVEQATISNDLKAIQADWRKRAVYNLDEYKARELARLDALELEYWAAWEKSKGEKYRSSQKLKAGEDGDPVPVEQTATTETMLGNPAFLSGVERCIDLRCKIIGIYAAVKSQVEIKRPDFSSMTAQEIREWIAQNERN